MLLDRFFLYTKPDVLNRYKQVMFCVNLHLLSVFICNAFKDLSLYHFRLH